VGACEIDQDLAHHVSRESHEMRAAVPVNVVADETDVCFVDQRSGLEGVVGPLATHIGFGEAVKLGINQRKKTLGRRGITRMHRLQQECNLARSWFHVRHA
jgi:hypothetical protein